MEHIIAGIGLSVMIGLSGAGSAMGLVSGGSATLGMIRKRPEAFGSGLVLSALPATQGLYGFLAFFLYLPDMKSDLSMYKAGIILGAGLAVGFVSLISAVQQGRVCANGIDAIGGGHDAFGRTMILAAFPEFYSILGLVGAILLRGV